MPGFLGQGKVLIGLRKSDGTPDLLRWIGNASAFSLSLGEETVERNESYSGNRLPLRRATRSRQGNIELTFDEFSADNEALMLIGAVTEVAAAAAVSGWTAPANAKVGSIIALPAKNVSAVAVKDSTGSPKTLPPAGYSLDAAAGTIELLDITTGGPYVQPFKVDYTPGAHKVVGAFKQATAEVYIRLNGINTDDGSRVIVDVFRARLSPTQSLPLIGDDFADFQLQGTVLADLTRVETSAGGQFFSLTHI
ncbi:MAG: hypothetical protein HZB72_09200 [Burkholderiales bacterium]|nr:hypothetical protein [Burkholderiales bacterium]